MALPPTSGEGMLPRPRDRALSSQPTAETRRLSTLGLGRWAPLAVFRHAVGGPVCTAALKAACISLRKLSRWAPSRRPASRGSCASGRRGQHQPSGIGQRMRPRGPSSERERDGGGRSEQRTVARRSSRGSCGQKSKLNAGLKVAFSILSSSVRQKQTANGKASSGRVVQRPRLRGEWKAGKDDVSLG